uniref:non-specific serine/threonine protein kinase n=1 Tax=Clastoptera arizonana TaxID=38151 RepID=A0A1B6CHP2_9HEMI
MKRRQPPLVYDNPKKRIAANGLPLPNPIREGEFLTDLSKKTWKLGRSIGLGGFGEIYLASDDLNRPVSQNAKYVIKVEPHKNGPLFVEMNFYIRVAKIEMIDSWMAKRGLPALGMPYYVGSGSHYYNGERYRFLVLPRYGQDIQKMFLQQGRRFHVKTAFTLASYIMDSLQYIHDHEYIHADIKGSNLMLGFNSQAPVYLIDFGLATRYINREGKHKEYIYDERRAHDGTIEYTSRDAHNGVHSRRGDLEILGYNLVQWLSGKLPWEGQDLEPDQVQQQKINAMKNVNKFLRTCFSPEEPPVALYQYLIYVGNLSFETKPDYKYCKTLFNQGIREAGYQVDGIISFTNHQKRFKIKKKKNIEPENKGIKKKIIISAPSRKPCIPKNVYRITTRKTANGCPSLKSETDFDWAQVLSGNPEKMLRKTECVPTTKIDSTPPEIPRKFADRHNSQLNDSIPEKLDNPTPEMIRVWERMKQRHKEQQLNNSHKRNKSARYGNIKTNSLRMLKIRC